MGLLVVLVLGLSADAAKAGVAYRAGLDALSAGRYDAAVEKFRKALGHEAGETDKLQYRDGARRHKHAYYPHYEWARARLLQAAAEKSATRRVEQLREAIVHLGLTKFPGAGGVIKDARVRLAKAEKAARPAPKPEDPFTAPYAALRRKLELLCDAERFEEAFSMLASKKTLFEGHEKERSEVAALLRGRRTRVVERYERLLALALENLSAVDPVDRGRSLVPFFERAQMPAQVQARPAPPFVWIRSFRDLYVSELKNVGGAATLEVGALIKTASAFERASERALEAGSFDGFRGALHVARSVRMARLRTLARERGKALDALLDSSEKAGVRCREVLRGRVAKPGGLPVEAMKRYGDTVLAAGMKEVREIRAGAEAWEERRAKAVDSIVQAEKALVHPDTMADQAALEKLGRALAALPADPAWRALPAELRARTYLARAISGVIIGLLRGEKGEDVRSRCEGPASKAFELDGGVAARWNDRLSPRILALLDDIKPK